jgi:hypothetical protein
MSYCNHPFDTQTNESINQSIANVAPKSVCYFGTNSLNSRISLVVGLHNLGYHDFFSKLFEALGISMPNNDHLSKYLNNKDGRKEWKCEYQKKITVKLNRSQQQQKTRDKVFKERTYKSYGPGVGLSAGIVKIRKVDEFKAEPDKTEPKKCCKCGSNSLQRPTHRECMLNKNKTLTQTAAAATMTLTATTAIVTAPPTVLPL